MRRDTGDVILGGCPYSEQTTDDEEPQMPDFNGRPILVTGAAGGIGGATVRQLVAAGADVIAGGRSEESLEPIARETGARTLAFDLESEESVAAALTDLDVYGRGELRGLRW